MTTAITARKKLTTIPSAWPQAATFLADSHDEMPLSNDDWHVVIRWLRETDFDSRSVLAGEVAAGMIRDHAPMHIKDYLLDCEPTDEWQQHFQRIVLSPFRPFEKKQRVTRPNATRKVTRRRLIDPTLAERNYSFDEIEFMKAMDDYKRKSGRAFPTWPEVLEVVHRLGYVKLERSGDEISPAETNVGQEIDSGRSKDRAESSTATL